MLGESRYWLVRDTPGPRLASLRPGRWRRMQLVFFKGVAQTSLRSGLVSALPLSTRTRH